MRAGVAVTVVEVEVEVEVGEEGTVAAVARATPAARLVVEPLPTRSYSGGWRRPRRFYWHTPPLSLCYRRFPTCPCGWSRPPLDLRFPGPSHVPVRMVCSPLRLRRWCHQLPTPGRRRLPSCPGCTVRPWASGWRACGTVRWPGRR